MANFMARFSSETCALLRIVAGFLFLWHGSQKVLGFPGGFSERPFHIAYIAGPIEHAVVLDGATGPSDMRG